MIRYNKDPYVGSPIYSVWSDDIVVELLFKSC